MIISFIGPSGSGKGTQANLFSKKGFSVISGGNILREEYDKKTEFGIKMHGDYWGKGLWVPDEIISSLVLSAVDFNQENILFDAFPRTYGQVLILDKFLKDNDKDLFKIFEFSLPKNKALKRLKKRKDNREDDKSLDIISNRFDSYDKNIDSIRSFYFDKLVLIDASNSIETIFNLINGYLYET
jgi:adenylate kinase